MYFIIEHLCVIRICCWSLLSHVVFCNHTFLGCVFRVLVFECLPFRVAQVGNIPGVGQRAFAFGQQSTAQQLESEITASAMSAAKMAQTRTRDTVEGYRRELQTEIEKIDVVSCLRDEKT